MSLAMRKRLCGQTAVRLQTNSGIKMASAKAQPMKRFVLQNGVFYVVVLVIAFGLKYHYSKAGSDELTWILAPTAGLVEQFSGIRFENETPIGFVNHEYRVIIAPSCAGVNFLIIAFCMAGFYGIHRLGRWQHKMEWLAAGAFSAYLLTLVVNTLRIILAIFMYHADIYRGWITPQRMHRLEGIVIYFFFLCLFYMIIKMVMHTIARAASGKQKENSAENYPGSVYFQWICAGLIPMFWYVLITLGVPLINGAYRSNAVRFAEHGIVVICGCLIVVAALFLIQFGWQRFKNRVKRCT